MALHCGVMYARVVLLFLTGSGASASMASSVERLVY